MCSQSPVWFGGPQTLQDLDGVGPPRPAVNSLCCDQATRSLRCQAFCESFRKDIASFSFYFLPLQLDNLQPGRTEFAFSLQTTMLILSGEREDTSLPSLFRLFTTSSRTQQRRQEASLPGESPQLKDVKMR